jgi:hypothetical protein
MQSYERPDGGAAGAPPPCPRRSEWPLPACRYARSTIFSLFGEAAVIHGFAHPTQRWTERRAVWQRPLARGEQRPCHVSVRASMVSEAQGEAVLPTDASGLAGTLALRFSPAHRCGFVGPSTPWGGAVLSSIVQHLAEAGAWDLKVGLGPHFLKASLNGLRLVL